MLEYNYQKSLKFYTKKYSNFTYMKSYAEDKQAVEKIIKYLNNRKLNTQTYLDIGCGFGHRTYAMSQYFKSSLRIDFIQNSIDVANLLNDQPNLEFKCDDFNHIDTKFDMISLFGLSNFNISNLNELKQNFLSLKKNLNKNGTVIYFSSSDFSGKNSTGGWYMHSKKQLNTLIKSLESNYTNIQLIILEDNWKEKIKRYIKFNFVREYIIIMDKKSA